MGIRFKARPVYLAIKEEMIAASDRHHRSFRRCDAVCPLMRGSFIIDGARGSGDRPRPDDYDLPGYFDHGADIRSTAMAAISWMQAAGHTLVINGCNQVPNACTTILGSSQREPWWCLTSASRRGSRLEPICRGAALIDGGSSSRTIDLKISGAYRMGGSYQ